MLQTEVAPMAELPAAAALTIGDGTVQVVATQIPFCEGPLWSRNKDIERLILVGHSLFDTFHTLEGQSALGVFADTRP